MEINELKLTGTIKVQALIRKAEQAREEGGTWRAIDILFKAGEEIAQMRGVVLDSKLNLLSATVIGHEIVCYKHLYENEDDRYLADMESLIAQGFALDIPDEHKAVFYLRHADVLSLKGELVEAESSYQKAYDMVKKLDNQTSAEYLGHLAEAKAANGSSDAALALIEYAIQVMNRLQSQVVRWHWLIIVSGLYGRMVGPALKEGRYVLALKSLWNCYWMSNELAKVHGMPQRRKQFYRRLLRRDS